MLVLLMLDGYWYTIVITNLVSYNSSVYKIS